MNREFGIAKKCLISMLIFAPLSIFAAASRDEGEKEAALARKGLCKAMAGIKKSIIQIKDAAAHSLTKKEEKDSKDQIFPHEITNLILYLADLLRDDSEIGSLFSKQIIDAGHAFQDPDKLIRVGNRIRNEKTLITSIAVGKYEDAQYIATGTSSGDILISDANTGKQISKIVAHFGPVKKIIFKPAQLSKHGGIAAVKNNKLWLWKLDGTLRWKNIFPSEITAITFSPYPQHAFIAIGCADGNSYILDIMGKKREKSEFPKHAGAVLDIVISPDVDNKFIVTCSADKTIQMYDLQGKPNLSNPIVCDEAVTRTVIFPEKNSMRLATISTTGSFQMYDLEGKKIKIRDNEKIVAQALSLARTGMVQNLVTGADGMISLLDQDGKLSAQCADFVGQQIVGCAENNDKVNPCIVIATNNQIKLWEHVDLSLEALTRNKWLSVENLLVLKAWIIRARKQSGVLKLSKKEIAFFNGMPVEVQEKLLKNFDIKIK